MADRVPGYYRYDLLCKEISAYITNDYSMRQVLRLYLEAWRVGVKTIYYVRSKALEVEDCESCSS